jgi:hypothetical protein
MYRNIFRVIFVIVIAVNVVPNAYAQSGLPNITIPTDGKEIFGWVKSTIDTGLTAAGIDRERFRFFDDATNWLFTTAETFDSNDFIPALTRLWDQVSSVIFRGIQVARGLGAEGLITEGIRLTKGLFDAGIGLLNSITR